MTILITDRRTAEMRCAGDYFAGRGDEVLTPPEALSLWDEDALRAFLAPYADTLDAVIHPAPPLFQKSVEEATEDDFAAAAKDGPVSAWCVTKVCAELFRKKGGGVIIYLNSIHAEKPMGYGFLFSAGCGAVQMLAREANQDFRADGILTYFVQRGISATDPDAKSDVSGLYFGVDQRYAQRRMPETDALNGLLAFLMTPAAAPLAGSDLRADGGLTMYYGQYLHERGGDGRV